MRTTIHTLLWFGSMGALATPCAAQVKVEITPFLGAYWPDNDFGSNTVTYYGVDTYYTTGASFGQEDGPIVGAQFTVWSGKRVAVELVGGYSPTGTINRQDECGGQVTGLPATVHCPTVSNRTGEVAMGSARLLFNFFEPKIRVPLPYLIAGGSVVNHSGFGVDEAQQTLGMVLRRTYWGPIVGLGIRLPFTSSSAGRVEFVGMQPGTESNLDYLLSAGLSMCLWRCTAQTGAERNP